MKYFTTSLTSFTLALSFLALPLVNVGAVPLPTLEQKRDVWTPSVTSPTNVTVWKVGSLQNVTWDASKPPAQITNDRGRIVLRNTNGFIGSSYEQPLAGNFSLHRGYAEVTVPSVPDGSDYQIVLFGDSGNVSPAFTITT